MEIQLDMHREDKVRNICIGLFIAMLVIPFFWLKPYYDDMMRYYYGYISLKGQGRILTEYYYRFAGGYSKNAIVNLNVFNLIAVSVGLFFVLAEFTKKVHINNQIISICATIAVLSSPFLLENLSYHVDNIGMMLSFVVALYASFYTCDIDKKNILITSGLIVISVLFYQASLNVYCASVVVLALSRIIYDDNFNIRKFVTNKIISFIVAIIIIFIFNKIIMKDGYANAKSELVSLSLGGFNKVIENIVDITNLFTSSFNKLQIVLFAILACFSVVGIFSIFLKYYAQKNKNWFKIFILLTSLPLLFVFAYFPAALFVDAVLEPRVFMSFGFILAGIIVAASSMLRLNKWVIGTSLAFSISILMSSSAYVATSLAINDNEERILFRIESDIRYALNDNGIISISFLGRPEASSSEKSSFRAFPIIPRILRRVYGDSWHNPAFVGMNSPTLQYVELSNEVDYLPVLNRPDYTLSKSKDGKYLVSFIPMQE